MSAAGAQTPECTRDMQLFTRETVFTCQSLADYSTLTARTPELPDTLDEMLEELGEDKASKSFYERKDVILQALVTALQTNCREVGSIQLWMLFVFNKSIHQLAHRYSTPAHSDEETYNDIVWCFLETLHRFYRTKDQTFKFVSKNLLRDTVTRIRRHYGYRDSIPKEPTIPLDDLQEAGWDAPQPEQIDYIRSLPISDADKYLLIGQHLYGYNQKEMAEKLGISPTALRQRHSRLLKRIRKIEKK